MTDPIRASRRRASRVDATLVLGLILLGLIVLISVLGPLLSDPTLANVGAVRPRRPPGPDFWLGTDAQGRDMLTLMLNATPNTLKMGLIAGVIGVGFGTLVGPDRGPVRRLDRQHDQRDFRRADDRAPPSPSSSSSRAISAR